MGLRGYILKRVLYSVILTFLVITLNFAIFTMMPGGPMSRLADVSRLRSEDQIEYQLRRFGLLDPPHIRYVKYVQSMLTFQFGYSYFTGRLIYEEIGSRIVTTFSLVITAEIISIAIGLVLGIFAAHKRGGVLDTTSSIASIIGNSLPIFWVGMLLILVFSYTLGWFPIGMSYPQEWNLPGRWPTNPLVELGYRLQHLVLPTTALVIILSGGYLLLTRASMIEVLSEDYLVTARAKGLRERTILFKHAFRNAALPVMTYIAIEFGFMLSGATLTETVFSYPGLGYWIWQSIDNMDFPALQAIFYLIALCVIVANFAADIFYGYVDPRIKYG